MDWLFDLGNSRLKYAALAGGAPGPMQALAHDGVTAPEQLPRGGTAWLASVVPPALAQALAAALAARFEQVRQARTLPALGRLRVAYGEPARLGVDRFLAMLGALEAGGGPWLVVGVGTALAIDALDADGRHLGGRIAPSPTLMRAALHARVPHLPAQGGRPVDFAADSADALASGCEGAALALVQDSRARARAAFAAEPALLLHGGGADALAPRLPAAVLRPELVLEGLAAYARLRTEAGEER
jgi:type III pantothenate kinase